MTDSDIEKASNGTVNIMNSDNFKKLTESGKKLDKTIMNLDNNGNGTHWTSIKQIAPHEYKYSDSFGVEPPFKLKNSLIYFNPHKKQKDYEVNCGARALNSLR